MKYSNYKKLLDHLKSDNRHGATFIEDSLFKILIKASENLMLRDYKKLVKHAARWPAPMAKVAFLGADAICRQFFINKIGTLAFASHFPWRKKEIWLSPKSQSQSSGEKNSSKIGVVNSYFEKIYFKDNMVFINESGLFTLNKVKKYLEKTRLQG